MGMALIYLLIYTVSPGLVLIREMALAGCVQEISVAFGFGTNPVF